MNELSSNSVVSLREITGDSLHSVLRLSVTPEQKQFVAPNSVSIAEAHFSPDAWFRAIFADDTPVGFVMLSLEPDTAQYYLWRYMIDHRYQGYGFGYRAMERIIDFVKTQPNAEALMLSYVEAEGDPRGFYVKLGFVDTGEQDEDEWVMRLGL